jgi:hypothetical protein
MCWHLEKPTWFWSADVLELDRLNAVLCGEAIAPAFVLGKGLTGESYHIDFDACVCRAV